MNTIQFATRMNSIPRSFIREILKATSQPDVISFAGGLPNPEYFPAEGIARAAQKVLNEDSRSVLQYGVSEGYYPLRKFISERYKSKHGIEISPEEILIVNGSQQGIDLAGKIFIDQGDKVLLENPSYLGAIQAFSAYQPEFITMPLLEDGPDAEYFKAIMKKEKIRLFYSIPNFQNPSGISYSLYKREIVSDILKAHDTILVEDDPYGEIRFSGESLPPLKKFLPQNSVLLGSFSKIMAPGLRLGWVAAQKNIIEKMIIAKQACDLHSNFLSQRVIYQFLKDEDLDEHIERIRSAYKVQCHLMLTALEKYFPAGSSWTRPEGGIFIWVTLAERMNAYDFLKRATEHKILFVPGKTFFAGNGGENTIRLNFSNSTAVQIEEGIKRLGIIISG
ncbi:MAG TPA: PLP-dependent aminotransferase family protein [Cytophagaceae bacterium]|nr:PLP-dependent aminotransferase family protein [Cytophagaceae bacterium]